MGNEEALQSLLSWICFMFGLWILRYSKPKVLVKSRAVYVLRLESTRPFLVEHFTIRARATVRNDLRPEIHRSLRPSVSPSHFQPVTLNVSITVTVIGLDLTTWHSHLTGKWVSWIQMNDLLCKKKADCRDLPSATLTHSLLCCFFVCPISAFNSYSKHTHTHSY